jgi:tRNA uridine 5-carboxymethylaminomethyl modification enzyme
MRDEIARFKVNEGAVIPETLDYATVPGLSTEARQRLAEVRPRSLGQAARVPGVTPAAVSILAVWTHRLQATTR